MKVHMEILRYGARAKVTIDIDYPSDEEAERGLQRFIEAGVAMQATIKRDDASAR